MVTIDSGLNLPGTPRYVNANISNASKLMIPLKQVIGTSCSTMTVVFDSANRKFGLSTPGDKVMDVMGILIPTVYGFTSFASGIWHLVNIHRHTEPGVSRPHKNLLHFIWNSRN